MRPRIHGVDGSRKKSVAPTEQETRVIAKAAAAWHAQRPATRASRAARKAWAVLHDLGREAPPVHVVFGSRAGSHRHRRGRRPRHRFHRCWSRLKKFGAGGVALRGHRYTVFVVRQPSSAASSLPLVGRVGPVLVQGGIRPGHVISFGTKGSATEL